MQIVVSLLVREWRPSYQDLNTKSIEITNDLLVKYFDTLKAPLNVMTTSAAQAVEPPKGLSSEFIESVFRVVVEALRGEREMLLVQIQRLLYLFKVGDVKHTPYKDKRYGNRK